GEDKPLKYPLIFQVAYVALLKKIDLLPYLDVDVDIAVENLKKVHPKMPVFQISAKTGEGFGGWIEWLEGCVKSADPEG
ncbi:MAG: hydrogenase accessory protein HypB, partial [Desulfamplus sp.]|nr:hydrogenase accessory protein HypB [Desulfamplus sp.]